MTENHGEMALVEFFRRAGRRDAGRVPIGIGDDMACLRTEGNLVLITADMLLEGVHFDRGAHSPEEIGRKAMACSLSDCAAMACRPMAATVSLGLNEGMTQGEVEGLFEGMEKLAREFDCPIVGGDTNSWAGGLVVDVAMLAQPATRRGPVRRDGARPGDALYVTGVLGGSPGGHHLTFGPRVGEAIRLAETLHEKLHAMMDLSDGLSLDLWRLCRASGAGAVLEADALEGVARDSATSAAKTGGSDAIEHALNDGEDFELLLAVDADAAMPDIGVRITRIGSMVESGMTIRFADGRTEPLEPRGYEHFK